MATNANVAHNWAHQTQKSNGGNFFYKGQFLYSYGYHFCVGAITEDGQTAILTSRSYSNATAKHKNHAFRAVSHMNRIFCSYPESAIRGQHKENLAVWQKEATSLMAKGDKHSAHKLSREIGYTVNEASSYCNYFGIPSPKWIEEANNKIEQLRLSPKWAREVELAATKEERRAAAAAKTQIKNLSKFRNYEIGSFSSSTQYLRMNGENVCTSLGVCITSREFMAHYNRLIHKENLVGTKVDGSYAILSVTDQFVKIGCHTISRDEINMIANQINKQTND